MELALQPRALAEDQARDLEIDLGGLGAKHEGRRSRQGAQKQGLWRLQLVELTSSLLVDQECQNLFDAGNDGIHWLVLCC